MSAKQFVDTNVLVYSRDTTEPEKHAIAAQIMRRLWQDRTGVISTQVCNEFYVTVTRKLDPGLTPDEAWDDLDALFAWNPIPVNTACIRVARHVELRYGVSWWDSLIIAACSQAGCTEILSEDLNPNQEYLGIRVANPFENAS
ncbi:MAG: PIN domain-containing protein [Spirochaetaceae bacterium]|nr:MAG: PIN domain-containing protein [Spirochaetaceae bacterium]